MSEGRKYTKSEADADASTNDEQNERGPMRTENTPRTDETTQSPRNARQP